MREATKPSTDPFAYRWFTVRGSLVAGGKRVMIATGAHADDLPEGEAAKTDIAERVRKHYAALYGDPKAAWDTLDVAEVPPENGFFDVRLPFEPLEPNDTRRASFEVDLGDGSEIED